MAGRFIAVSVVLGVLTLQSYSYGTVVTDVRIKAGPKGLALVFETDKPFTQSYSKKLEKNNTVITLTLKNCIWAQGAFSFSDFPAGSPVKTISTKKAGTGVSCTVVLMQRILGEVLARMIDNKVVFLLSNEPYGDFEWNSSAAPQAPVAQPSQAVRTPQTQESQAGADQNTIPAALSSIHQSRRDAVEQLVIETDSPVPTNVKDMGTVIVAVFLNTKNGLDKSRYVLPANSFFKMLTIRQSMSNGVPKIGIRIEKATFSTSACFFQSHPRGIILYAIHQDIKPFSELSWWVADMGVPFHYAFKELPAADHLPAQQQQVVEKKGVPYPEPAVTARVVVIGDRVNLRSEPASQKPGTVLKKLKRGTTGTQLKKQGAWCYLELDKTREKGWVTTAMISDSTQLTKEQWETVAGTGPKSAPPQPQAYDEVSDAAPSPGTGSTAAFPKPQSLDNALLALQKKGVGGIPSYKVYGRDPFIPLTDYSQSRSTLPDVENSVLAGILYDEKDRVALVETRGKDQVAFALREGEPVLHGRLQKITPNSAVFLIEDGGLYRQFVLRMKIKKE